MAEGDEDLKAASAEFLALFGEETFPSFIRGFKKVYKNRRMPTEIWDFGLPRYGQLILEHLRKARDSKDEKEKAELLGMTYGFGLSLIDFGIANPRYWEVKVIALEERREEIDEILSKFREIGKLLKEMERGVGSDFLKRKISKIARERGKLLPREVQLLIAQIAALVKK